VDVADALRRRHMVRAFLPAPLEQGAVDSLIDDARRSPSAGNTAGWAFVVLEGSGETERYWDVTLPAERRASFAWPGLLAAPVLVLPYVRPDAWVERYAEPDKAAAGLGDGTEAWLVPYWWVDGGGVVTALLLGATAQGLGGCLFGQFEHEDALRAAFGVPDGWRALGTVALGRPAPGEQRPGRSASRPRPALSQVVHRGGW
jgi:nitroreductase